MNARLCKQWAVTLSVAVVGSFTLVAQAATVQVTVTGKDGQPLPDAVVVVEPANGARGQAPTPTQVSIDQQKMQFVPAVTVVPLGSRVRFSNLDSWEHHVRGVPAGLAGLTATKAAGFELRLAGREGGQPAASSEITLTNAGPFQLGCHLHGSMRGFVFVADTPWAVKTDAQGVATLRDLPEGAARVRVLHADQLVEPAPLTVQLQTVSAFSVPTQVVPRRRRL